MQEKSRDQGGDQKYLSLIKSIKNLLACINAHEAERPKRRGKAMEGFYETYESLRVQTIQLLRNELWPAIVQNEHHWSLKEWAPHLLLEGLFFFYVNLKGGYSAWVHQALSTLVESSDSSRAVRPGLISLLSTGKIGNVYQICLALGRLHLLSDRHTLWEKAEPTEDEQLRRTTNNFLQELVIPAYKESLAGKNYGVSLALLELSLKQCRQQYEGDDYQLLVTGEYASSLGPNSRQELYERVAEKLTATLDPEDLQTRRVLHACEYAHKKTSPGFWSSDDFQDGQNHKGGWDTAFKLVSSTKKEVIKDLSLHWRNQKFEQQKKLLELAQDNRQSVALDYMPDFLCPTQPFSFYNLERRERVRKLMEELQARQIARFDSAVQESLKQLPDENELKPLVIGGGRAEWLVVDKDLIDYATAKGERMGGPDFLFCLADKTKVQIGSKALVIFDYKGHRRAVFCSVRCQHAYREVKKIMKKGK